ncbi:MAG: hypothetical protein CVV48_12975 [Spirochaetae bacterium HGW-Spirochaetae-4]|nr:MAG: hypothetical protein CVV48_12975 [Spirochaetae bacterium HGW-Spirochaetae-4]
MVFAIDDELKSNITTMDNEDLAFVIWLGVAIQANECGFFASKEILEIFVKLPSVRDSHIQRVYYRLLTNYAQLKSLYDVADLIICISYSEEESGVKNGKTIVNIPYNKVRHDLFRKPYFIVENTEDISFLIEIAKWYERKILKASNGRYNYEAINGGGSTISGCLQDKFDSSKTPIICVVDSDYKYPGCLKKGSTASTCGCTWENIVQADRVRSSWCKYRLLSEVKEIENLIPHDLILTTCNGNDNFLTFIEFLKRIENANVPHLLNYFDYKKGLRESEIYKHRQGKSYYYELLKMSGISEPEGFICQIFEKPNELIDQIKDTEGDKIIPGAISALLRKVVCLINEKQIQNIEVPMYLEGLWTDIGRTVLTWTVVDPNCYFGSS